MENKEHNHFLDTVSITVTLCRISASGKSMKMTQFIPIERSIWI